MGVGGCSCVCGRKVRNKSAISMVFCGGGGLSKLIKSVKIFKIKGCLQPLFWVWWCLCRGGVLNQRVKN